MKNRNTQLTAILFVIAFALAPLLQAAPSPDGGPIRLVTNEAPRPDGGPVSAITNPIVTVHETDSVIRGKTGSFVLNMNPSMMVGGIYVNFSLSGTAIPGVDYVQPLSPAYIGASGYGVILIKTLADPRGSSFRQAYSIVVTLKPGAGYSVGAQSSATMWIKP